MLERFLTGGVRGLCDVPIRHQKTWTTLHGMAWVLERDPTYRWILMCADHERANELGKGLRKLCESVAHQSGIAIGPLRGENTIVDWKNGFGGGCVVMSAEQSRLGRDVDGLVVDDAITEKTARDRVVKDAVDNAIAEYTARAGRMSRRGSVACLMSRWADDDPIGRRSERLAREWEHVHHSAIIDMGLPSERAFAPDVMSLEEIKLRREELREVDPSEWYFFAQFQNEPFTPSSQLFLDPGRYEKLPEWGGFRTAYGFDAAFSQKKSADYFAIVVTRWHGSSCYVLESRRFRADYGSAVNAFLEMKETWGAGSIFSYMSGPEIGSVVYFGERGINVNVIPARYDKRTRAQKTIDKWNRGMVLVPARGPAWVEPLVTRAKSFRGIDGDDDDEIDALVSVCDGTGFSGVGDTRTFGGLRVAR
jgi:phage terminase large subunit-like protein